MDSQHADCLLVNIMNGECWIVNASAKPIDNSIKNSNQ